MTTAHIAAQPGDFAPHVLMPGDPRRAQRIAEDLFDDAKLVTDVRGALGYTGTYQGMPISVMASGMGMPSITIYATELYREFGVRNIIRVGTAGGFTHTTRMGDVVIASGAHTDSAMTKHRVPGVQFSHVASPELLIGAIAAAERAELAYRVGTVFSTDHFYLERPDVTEALVAYGALCVEMEAAALYAAAAGEGTNALAVLSISDHFVDQTHWSPAEREMTFRGAAEVALGALLQLPS